MRLDEIVLDVNKKGVKLNLAKINADKGLLATARERASKELFEMGYLDHLGSFTDNEIIRILRSEYGDDIKHLYSNVDGSALLTRERLRLCKYTTKNEDLVKVIDVVGVMLKREELYRGLISLLKQVLNDNILYPSIVATSISVSSKFEALNNLDILDYLDFEDEVVYISDIRSTMYYEFLVSIGVDEDVIGLSKNNNKGVLLSYLTYSQELSILDLILQYEVVPDTEYKISYLRERRNYYTSKDRFSAKVKYMKNNYKNLEELVDVYSTSGLDIKLCSDKYILYTKTDAYEYSLDSFLSSNRIINSRIEPSWSNSSNYCRAWQGKKIAGVSLLIGGYAGEFVYTDDRGDLDSSQIVAYKNYNVSTREYQEVNMTSIKNTKIESNYNNIRPLNLMDVDVIFGKFGATDEASLFAVIDTEVERRYSLYNFSVDLELLDVKLILRDVVYGILHALVEEEFRASYNNREILRQIYTTDVIYKIGDLARSILKKYKIV